MDADWIEDIIGAIAVIAVFGVTAWFIGSITFYYIFLI